MDLFMLGRYHASLDAWERLSFNSKIKMGEESYNIILFTTGTPFEG